MIHRAIQGPYRDTFWLKVGALGVIMALLASILSMWLLSYWFERHANTTARVQRLERQVAYLEGRSEPLVTVNDGGHVTIIPREEP